MLRGFLVYGHSVILETSITLCLSFPGYRTKRGYRTKHVGFVVTFRLAGAEKSVLKLVGANLARALRNSPHAPNHNRQPRHHSRPSHDRTQPPSRANGGFYYHRRPATACRRRVTPLWSQFPPLSPPATSSDNPGHHAHRRSPQKRLVPRQPKPPSHRHHPRLGRRNLLQRTPPHHPLPQHLGLTPQPTRFVL